MAVEKIGAGKLVTITDVLNHEYEIDDDARNPRYGPSVRTVSIKVVSGTIKFAVGKAVPNDHNGYGAGDTLNLDVVKGIANLNVLGTNPSSFSIT